MPDLITFLILIAFIALLEIIPSRLAEKRRRPTSTQAADLVLYRYNKHQYLRSPEWKSKRLQALKSAGYSCQMCGAQTSLHVHHITYTNLYRETPADLACVCEHCHSAIHSHHGFPQTLKDYESFHGPLLPLY